MAAGLLERVVGQRATINFIIRGCHPDRLESLVQFLIENWYLFVVAAVSGGLLLWPVISSGGSGSNAVSTTEAVRMINREKAIVIDVGEPAEYAAGHVAGARSLPFGSIDSAKPGSKDGAKGLPANKASPLIVVCPTGARASRAVGMLRKLGYANVQSMAGGLRAWRDANLPIEKSA
jgi:rhodanese-related sulfurtransferase